MSLNDLLILIEPAFYDDKSRIIPHEVGETDKPMLLAEALKLYLEELKERQSSQSHLRTVAWRLGQFIKPRADQPLASVTRAQIAAHFTELRETRSDGTMAGFTSSHRSFWRWLEAEGHTAENLGEKLRSFSYEPTVRDAAPLDDIQAVLAALWPFVAHRGQRPRDVRDALLVSLSIDSGARLGAMRRIRRSKVDQALRSARATRAGPVYDLLVVRDKTGTSHLRFFNDTAELFRIWLPLLPPAGDFVFVSLTTGQLLRADSLSRGFERICRFAGVPVFRSHAVRKRNVTDILEQADPETAQRYAGHRDLETTLRHYKQKKQGQVDEAAASLSAQRRRRAHFDNEMANLFGLDEDEQ